MATSAQLSAATASLIADLDAMVAQKAPGFMVSEVENELKTLAPQWAANALAAAEKAQEQSS